MSKQTDLENKLGQKIVITPANPYNPTETPTIKEPVEPVKEDVSSATDVHLYKSTVVATNVQTPKLTFRDLLAATVDENQLRRKAYTIRTDQELAVKRFLLRLQERNIRSANLSTIMQMLLDISIPKFEKLLDREFLKD